MLLMIQNLYSKILIIIKSKSKTVMQKFLEINKSLTEQQIEEYKEWFSLYQTEDQTISLQDFLIVLKQLDLSISDEESKRYKKIIDYSPSPYLLFPEFLNILVRKTIQTQIEDEIRDLYKMFDVNNNGSITATDLKNILTGLNPKITDQQVDSIILEADQDGDGVLNYQEFVYLCLPR